MKKSNALAAGFAMAAACAFSAAAFAAEADLVGNLTETSGKISSIDLDKNLGEAGKVLDGFYSGAKAKKDTSSSAVALEAGTRTLAQAEKEVCNAKPSKIVLSAKVPPLESGAGKSDSKEKRSSQRIRAVSCGWHSAGAGAGWQKERLFQQLWRQC